MWFILHCYILTKSKIKKLSSDKLLFSQSSTPDLHSITALMLGDNDVHCPGKLPSLDDDPLT